MKMNELSLPLYAGKKDDKNEVYDLRYIGNSFHVNDDTIATCAHVVEGLNEDELLFAWETSGQNLLLDLLNVKSHDKYDFAIANVVRSNFSIMAINNQKNYIGDRIRAYSYTVNRTGENGLPILDNRLFDGHIVRINGPELPGKSKSTCELSIPILSGFSGSPILGELENHPFPNSWRIIGMAYGNFDSKILSYQYSENLDNGSKRVESIYRVLELGLAHSSLDLLSYLSDLGVELPKFQHVSLFLLT